MDFQAFFRILRYKKDKTMGKYLKQGFVRKLEWQHAREEISHSKMVELIEEECIKNYKAEFHTTLNTLKNLVNLNTKEK